MCRADRLLKTILVGLIALLCASCGPHMVNQQSIKPYERRMPEFPTNNVPTQGRITTFTTAQSRLAANPVPGTPANIERGRIFYGYYCLMCHGSKGDGNGSVGQSYDPKPTDLRSPAVAALTDGQLYQRMLVGIGHDPVMIETVHPDRRWPLVLYVRQFSRVAAAPAAR